MVISSYPYRFMPGQPGQPGQTPETLANRSFRVRNLHIFAGTQPGHAGTLRYQDVAGQAKGRICGPLSLSRIAAHVVHLPRSVPPFSNRSQPRPSVPPWSLVGVVRQGLEALTAAQQVRGWGIGPAGDDVPPCSRHTSAIASQVPALSTAPPVVSAPFTRTNARQPGGRGRCLECRRGILPRFGLRRGPGIAPVQHAVPINHRRNRTAPAGYEPRGRAPRSAGSRGPATGGLFRCPCGNTPWRPTSAPRPPHRIPCRPRRAKPR